MTDTSGNPGGAGYFNAIDNGAVRQQYVIDPAVGGACPFGTVLELEDYAGPGTTNPPVVPLVQPSSTTPDTLVIGVLTGGLDYRGLQQVDAGTPGIVTTQGVVQVLCDATTTAGQALIQSPGVAGCARTAASPTSRTLGVCLQSVTISSGTALVWAFIDPGAEGSTGAGGVTSFDTRTGAVVLAAGDVESTFGAKGQLFAGSGAGTGGLVTVGADGLVLTADAASADGVTWAAAPAAALVTDAGSLGAPVTVNAASSAVIMSTASLAAGTWFITWTVTCRPGSTATGAMKAAGTFGTAGPVARSGGQVGQTPTPDGTGNEETTFSFCQKMVINAPGTLTLTGYNLDALIAGTIVDSTIAGDSGATGYTAIKVA